jgi:nicotinate-nucleotide adenylyltransferase
MRRLCFGGSFNPIHHGHLIGARAAAEGAGFDRVVLIPSALPPHKLSDNAIAAAEHRLAMCRLAVQADPMFEVDDLELTRNGPSYTVDTARQLRQRGWQDIHWLIGADTVPLLPEWHEPDALLREVSFVVMVRPGFELDWASLPTQLRPLRGNLVEGPRIEISASEIRRRVAAGESVRYLTPPAVEEYLLRNRLYR